MKHSKSLLLALGLVPVLVAVAPSQAAKTFTTLYSFTGGVDGGNLFGGVVVDSAGNIYGTTSGGGTNGLGTVFKIDVSSNLTTLHSFTDQEGSNPAGSLIHDRSGNLYGTSSGGAFNACSGGCGAIFKLDPSGKFRVQYRFTGGKGGSHPVGSLIRDAAGNLYGATRFGGAFDAGTIYKLDASGLLTSLYSFTGGADGGKPRGGVIADSAGNLYGTTSLGGASKHGVVFKLDSNGSENVLHSFADGSDGAYPFSGLVINQAGDLYGVTTSGGNLNAGVIFKIDSTGSESVLHYFTGIDGSGAYGGLIQDDAGNLYGTTFQGGAGGGGTVFRMDTNTGHFYRVCDLGLPGLDGGFSVANLARDHAGNLYGTGSGLRNKGKGTVFKITF